jgi:hypothetical protein
MATSRSMCPTCSRPILAGPGVAGRDATTHLTCAEPLGSVNTWPEGTRHLLCLNCARAFESDSKALRLCKVCRSRSDVAR